MKLLLFFFGLISIFALTGCNSGKSTQIEQGNSPVTKSYESLNISPVPSDGDTSDDKFQSDLSDIKSKFSDVSSDFDTLSSTIDDFRYSGENWRDTVDYCELHVSSLRDSLDDLESAIDDAEINLDSDNNEKRVLLDDIKSKFSDVSSDFDTLSSTIDDFRYSGENWRDTVDYCELHVSSLRDSLDDLESAIQSAYR